MTNAKFCRNLICAGLGALALGHVSLSHAFYAQATPPVGFVAGAINTFNGAKAGVTASVALGRIAANASLSVGGRAVGIATKIPLAANAARIAALAIYAHPAVRVGVVVATWVGLTGYLYNATKGVWEAPDPDAATSDGFEYSAGAGWFSSAQAACSAALKQAQANGTMHPQIVADGVTDTDCVFKWAVGGPLQGYQQYTKRASSCPTGWYVTPAGCVQSVPGVPVTAERFAEELVKHPMPPNILPELPFDLPVDVPYIEPIFIPTGNPVKNPKYDPTKPQTGENQPYVQPGVKVDPANDAKNPFQVNVQPSNRPTSSPNGSTDAQPITPGSGTETDGSNDQPKEDKDERDLCEKNPDILACQKVDTEVDDAEIPKAEKTVSYQPENPFGGGACPADKYARVGGQELKVVDWTRDCQFVRDYVTPVAFVLTTLIVGAILLGGLKP